MHATVNSSRGVDRQLVTHPNEPVETIWLISSKQLITDRKSSRMIIYVLLFMCGIGIHFCSIYARPTYVGRLLYSFTCVLFSVTQA